MADQDAADCRTASPLTGKKRAQQSPGLRPKCQGSAPGHCLRRVTLTKPTFCHSCSDFIWGLVGFLCEVCNFMCHEKCLKTLRWPCSCMTPAAVRVPVAHCFGPAGQKKRFCCVCRKPTEGNAALRCEVCELHVHADCAVFSCADCRSSHLDGTLEQDTFHHHWREGNLASAARCDVCRRSCGSSDVLAGIRCEWCGVTSHAACYLSVPPECILGRLRCMMLHPACVRLDCRNFSKMHNYRITESWGQDLGKQLLKVFDGDDALKRDCFRLVSIMRATKNEEVVEAALRAFYLPDEPQDFELLELGGAPRLHSNDILNRNGGPDNRGHDNRGPDNRGHDNRGPDNLGHDNRGHDNRGHDNLGHDNLGPDNRGHDNRGHDNRGHDNRGPDNRGPDNRGSLKGRGDAWLLRAKPRDAEVIKVYVGRPRSGAAFISVSVSKASTAASVLTEVLSLLHRQEEDASSFSLVEIYMSNKQVQRQTLTPQEKIQDKLQEIRKVSVRQMNQTRFYLVENRKRAVQVSLLIGGLTPLLTKDEYVQLIQDQLSIKSHLVTVSHVYTSQGAVALQVACFSEAERIYMLAKDTTANNKTLTSLVIPDIAHGELGADVCPLLVFVNPKSGGMKGRELLYSFRKLLNPHQVFDISNGGPLAGLHTFREVPRFRVLVCGGDGTMGWVLGVLEAVRHKLVCREPPIGIVPLGTGNDLARVLRWGAGFSGEDPHHILVSVDEADEVLMDRWTILLDAQDISEDGKDNGFLEPPKIVQMNNYFGLGIDAEVSLDFHQAREDDPDKFTSRFHNKGVYVKVGLQKISCTRSLHKELQLQVDAQNVPLPHIEGLIFLNIPSWGSGADLWGSEVDVRHGKPRIDDGLLEVVGVTGVVHMGQVQSGLRSGIRIAQGNYIRLTVSKPIPVQVDGEPWIQPPGHIIISAAGPKVRMLRKSKQKQKKSSRDGRSESPSSRDGGH
ncbi:diacylglycerol kinase theta-like isoform X2 [Cyclopterus lumpus]|uniref:diacylglycerol kinase theta-like isoform X2 n=1 Tax=Cyclopterus lumpus TaxID=8103 RepID=UPI0014862B2F|nr:diacylglycerol kinase theta-like isoform X2 [Cyclopterus lumpus]